MPYICLQLVEVETPLVMASQGRQHCRLMSIGRGISPDSKRLHTDSSVAIELRMVDTLRHRPYNRPDITMWNDTGDAFRILRQTDRDAEPASNFDTEVRELRAEWIQLNEPEAAR